MKQFNFVLHDQRFLLYNEIEDASDGSHEEYREDPSEYLIFPARLKRGVDVFPDDFVGLRCRAKQDIINLI